MEVVGNKLGFCGGVEVEDDGVVRGKYKKFNCFRLEYVINTYFIKRVFK